MRLKKLLKIYAKAEKIVRSKKYEWDETFNLIFSSKISYKVNKYLDYSDPDAGWEDDVLAFMRAFKAYVIYQIERT